MSSYRGFLHIYRHPSIFHFLFKFHFFIVTIIIKSKRIKSNIKIFFRSYVKKKKKKKQKTDQKSLCAHCPVVKKISSRVARHVAIAEKQPLVVKYPVARLARRVGKTVKSRGSRKKCQRPRDRLRGITWCVTWRRTAVHTCRSRITRRNHRGQRSSSA